MLNEIFKSLFGFRRPNLPLNLYPLPISELPAPDILSFSLIDSDGNTLSPLVREGEEVKAGQALAHDGGRPCVVSPVSGRVSLTTAPDLRGAVAGPAVRIEPAAGSSPAAFAALDPGKATAGEIRDRLTQAGVMTDSQRPSPLVEALWSAGGEPPSSVCVLALDREPEVSSALQLFRERTEDAIAATRMLARAAGAGRALLAVPESMAAEAAFLAERLRVEVLRVPPTYPQSLEPMVAPHCGPGPVRMVAVEAALAAYDAVDKGRVQDRKVLTVIGPDERPAGNFSVAIGAPLGQALAAAGVAPREGDKVVAGGYMRGYAQDSLQAAVDSGVDALVVIAGEDIVPWSDASCINCGACAAVCPADLQTHLIGRRSESGRFEAAEKLQVMSCVECGLCGSVCTARRPMLQFMLQAKREIRRRRAALGAAGSGPAGSPAEAATKRG